jgi:hypothetical protein
MQILDPSNKINTCNNGMFLVSPQSLNLFECIAHPGYEAIVSVSHDKRRWQELEFPCKPGSLDRRPCMCAPYHYRLDWHLSWRFFMVFCWEKTGEKMPSWTHNWLVILGHFRSFLVLVASQLFGRGNKHGICLAWHGLACFF